MKERKAILPQIKSRTITVGQLMNLAADLCTDPGDPPNLEYERAIAELVTDAAGISMEYKADVAREIGLRADVDSFSLAYIPQNIKRPLGKGWKGSRPKSAKGASARFGELGSRSLEV